MLKKIIQAVIMPKSKAPKQGFYAVHVGKTKGIYYTWYQYNAHLLDLDFCFLGWGSGLLMHMVLLP